jgi:hypothetical protein
MKKKTAWIRLRKFKGIGRMSPEKERAILERWPEWFRTAGDVRQSRRGERFCFWCGDGWYEIIFQLCERLEPLVANLDDAMQFQVMQVKEKFGGLRFYVEGSSNEIETLIDSACELSRRTCEVCGQEVGSLAQHGSLLRLPANGLWNTLCSPCSELVLSVART